MNRPDPVNECVSMDAERDSVRLAMRKQRRVIAQRLAPEPGATTNRFPRSMTLRFLTQRPTAAVQLFAGAATFLVGARAMTLISTALAVAGVVCSLARQQSDY